MKHLMNKSDGNRSFAESRWRRVNTQSKPLVRSSLLIEA
jgi:hypothetical protein